MTQLTDKIAVVTGGSRGIGKAIALELAKRGATVVVNYQKNADAANEVVEAITANGGQALAVQADVSLEDDANRLIKTTIDTYGKLDILVNNAGTTRDNVIMLMGADDFDTVIQTNLRSTWLVSKAAVRSMMRKRYGRVINITSISGIMGNAGQTNYSASKAGIIGLTKALAREVAPRGITVNAVAPGFVLTDLTANLPEDIAKKLNENIPLGRWGTVEDVASATAFLASDEASYITGHILTVDGGLAM
ncbi:MAG: 3-oxoacyl-[acyl-carrier-protein] reductase [Chloroflexi bacterium]|uniref:3-oxoacyl-[acyl-carrier-protein] reductase n=1 Tax=Candidatus Flexifilum breve TaxID=3140694 RepID=UPI0031351D0A|nr:3-oxoacyl-[acyl-carrier-protein] reductase [Chloroflexota bacterium]MBK9750695.1 3-oxoacyl-[acyl-carrier-protein] reductase [Chloroflexota bacterium]